MKFSGRGLHSGTPSTVVIHPSDQGLRFLHAGEYFAYEPSQVTDTDRCVSVGPIRVAEHVVSALAGLGYTDATIETSAPELPALDGASREYCDGLLAVAAHTFGEIRVEGPFARVFTAVDTREVAISQGEGRWRFEYDLGRRWPGLQCYEAKITSDLYVSEIAPARTIALIEEVEAVRARGLGHGVDIDSVIVLDNSGYYNPPRFENEAARHKMLDLIGDLALSEVPPTMLNVVAIRSGHKANVLAASRLAAAVRVAREGRI